MPLIAGSVIVTGEGSLEAAPIPGTVKDTLTVSERAIDGEHEVIYASESPPSPILHAADDCNVKKDVEVAKPKKEEAKKEAEPVPTKVERPKRKTRKRSS